MDISKEEKKAIRSMKKLVEKLQKENEDLRVQGSIIYLDYKILKDKVINKIEELQKYKKEIEDEKDEEYFKVLAQLRVLRDLLKEK